MTEIKKKTTKKEVVEKNDAPVKATKRARTKEKKAKTEPETEPGNEIKLKAESRSTASAEDFDWDNFESEELRNSPKYKEYENLYDETLSTVAVDEVVIGTVIQMTLREVVINIGYKSEGVVSLNEL